jgi:hypothetical protein
MSETGLDLFGILLEFVVKDAAVSCLLDQSLLHCLFLALTCQANLVGKLLIFGFLAARILDELLVVEWIGLPLVGSCHIDAVVILV